MKKKNNTNDDFLENEIYDEVPYNKRNIKSSRSREKNQARRKIDAYLERKSLKSLFNDYDDINSDVNDFMDDYMELDVNNYLNNYADDQDWDDLVSQRDNPDFRI